MGLFSCAQKTVLLVGIVGIAAVARAGDAKVQRLFHGRLVNCLKGVDELMQALVARPGSELHTPFLEFDPNFGLIEPGQVYSVTHVIKGTDSSLEEQLKIIRFANHNFKRRGWSENFLINREQLAKDFADRSVYLQVDSYTAKSKTLPPHSILGPPSSEGQFRGTIGLTHAGIGKEAFLKLTDETLLNQPGKILPMERTLGRVVTRNFDSQGRSIVVELRAFAKDQGSEELVRNSLVSDGISLTFHVIKDYPELYEKPIIYTYGDKASVRLYGALGFRVDENLTPLDKPIHHEGTDWWILSISPRDLEKNLFSLKGQRKVHNLNQPFPLSLPNGRQALAAPGSSLYFNKNGVPSYFHPSEPIEVAQGYIAAVGAEVNYSEKGVLRSVESLAEPAGFIPKGSQVWFWNRADGEIALAGVNTNGAPMQLPKGGFSVTGEARFRPDGQTLYYADGLMGDVEISPGLTAAAGSSIRFMENVPTTPRVLRPDRITLGAPFQEGRRVYPAGTTIDLRWNGDEPHVINQVRSE